LLAFFSKRTAALEAAISWASTQLFQFIGASGISPKDWTINLNGQSAEQSKRLTALKAARIEGFVYRNSVDRRLSQEAARFHGESNSLLTFCAFFAT